LRKAVLENSSLPQSSTYRILTVGQSIELEEPDLPPGKETAIHNHSGILAANKAPYRQQLTQDRLTINSRNCFNLERAVPRNGLKSAYAK
jgi:hypothetical protein